MVLNKEIAKHFRDLHFGGNWTAVNLKDTLADIDWQQAITRVHNFNTVAALVFHVNYYVSAVLKVLQGEPLQASDRFSFDVPPITSAEGWQMLITKTLTDAESFARQVEELDEARLVEDLADPQYGSYYQNLQGIIEHTYYHLGQITLIKKILNETNPAYRNDEGKAV